MAFYFFLSVEIISSLPWALWHSDPCYGNSSTTRDEVIGAVLLSMFCDHTHVPSFFSCSYLRYDPVLTLLRWLHRSILDQLVAIPWPLMSTPPDYLASASGSLLIWAHALNHVLQYGYDACSHQLAHSSFWSPCHLVPTSPCWSCCAFPSTVALHHPPGMQCM